MDSNINTRKILLLTIVYLILILFIWMDKLYLITSSYLSYEYEILKIVVHSLITYKVSKFLIKKLSLYEKINFVSPTKIFLFIFLVMNSYIICQYTARVITVKLVNGDIRKRLSQKINKVSMGGWGYEGDSLTIKEYRELTKYTNLPKLPESARFIYIYDWFEIQDYTRIVEFKVKPNFNLSNFYNNDTTILKNIEQLKVDFDRKTFEIKELDSTKVIKYKWEVGEI